MPATALALVVAAALLHALWNIAAKRAGGDARLPLLSGAMVAVLWAPAALWAGWHEVPRWGWQPWAVIATSAALHLAYFSALLKGYRVGDLTVVYPVARGSGPLITAAAAVLLLGEPAGIAVGVGAVAVAAGVVLIAGAPAPWRRAHDAARRARVAAGVRWGLLTGVCIAAYSVVDAYAVKVLLIGPLIHDYLCNVLRVPMMLPMFWRERAGLGDALRRHWRPALVVALLSPAAYILVLYAVTLAPLSHVAPAREVSMLVAALLGGRLLGEGERALRLLGAACIAGGVVVLAVG